MLQPGSRLRGATAVRFDEPAAVNRRGAGAGFLHALERRALGQVRLLLPIGLEPSAEAASVGVDTPMVALPTPIPVGPETGAAERERLVLTYMGNPDKKGLDLAVTAWAAASAPGWRLVVTGIDREAGRRWLERRGIPEPEEVEWTGLVPAERYRALLARAGAYLSTSHHEEYGLAQLEALGAGVPLVTIRASGPYEAYRFAAALDPRLAVDGDTAPALARALEAAISYSEPERAAYAARARELLRPHSREELRRRLEHQVLPVLLPAG
jgi:glycosyltransferase involved in cell wall biosynthesis